MPCKKHSGLANDRRAYYYSNCVKPTPPTPTPIPNPCSLLPRETPYQLCSPFPQIGGLDNLNSRYIPLIGSQTGNINVLQSLDTLSVFIANSSPTIASDGTIYICVNIQELSDIQGYIISFTSNGTIKWTYKLLGGDGFYGYGIFNIVPPTIGKDGILYIGSARGYVYAINPDSTSKWINQYKFFNTAGYIQAGLIIGTDDNIYFGLNGYSVSVTDVDLTSLLSIQSSDGTENWRYILQEDFLNIPVIPETVAIDKYNNIYFAYETTNTDNSKNNYVVCLDNFGNNLWICDITQGIIGTVSLSSRPTLSVDNSRLYILNNYLTGDNVAVLYYLNAINTNDGSIDNSQSITIPGKVSFYGGGSINSLARDLNDNLYFSITNISNYSTLYSVNKGTINWSYIIPTPPEYNNHAILTSPSVCLDGTIYFGLFFFYLGVSGAVVNNYMYAINPNKTTKWVKLITKTSTTSQPLIFSGFSINLQGNIILPCINLSNETQEFSGITLYSIN